MRAWLATGQPGIWVSAGAVSVSLIAVIGLVALIAVGGLGHFWPSRVQVFDYRAASGETTRVIASLREASRISASRLADPPDGVAAGDRVTRYRAKIAGRDVFGQSFRYLVASRIEAQRQPPGVVVLERWEWGELYGFLRAIRTDQGVVVELPEGGVPGADLERAWSVLQARLERARQLRAEIEAIDRQVIGPIDQRLEALRLEQRILELDGALDAAAERRLAGARQDLRDRYRRAATEREGLVERLERDRLELEIADGRRMTVALAELQRVYRPNAMGWIERAQFYGDSLWTFLATAPRKANTEGGVFPAILGTVVLVLLMTVFVTPFGILAAVYLREYAPQGPVTRSVRVAVNNLAGVPSIVYGVFGLGFFVYFIGGGVDRIFYPEVLPSPTFGSPGLLWAALTLALLTLPVVIVATEEGLERVPRSLREGSLALGATKAETLFRVILPMASPGLMTGLILAMARAAGEVAPLMLVGVVKLTTDPPIDGEFPYLHLDRKFMHLGFHIYDVGFQSPNVEAVRSLVYATALLLLLVIVLLNLAAILLRDRLRERYRAFETHA